MNELFDVALDEDRDIVLTDQNDIEVVRGVPNIEQSLGIALGKEARQLIGEQLDGTELRAFIGDLESAIDEDPQIEEATGITLEEIDKQTNTMRFTIQTIEGDFEVTL